MLLKARYTNMTLNAIGFLALGCIILYGGLITTIAIAVKSDKKDD